MRSGHRPEVTARGVGVVAGAYVALALFYTVAIALTNLNDGAGAVLDSFRTVTPRSFLDYGLKAALTVPVWWVVIRRLDGRPRLQALAHAVLGPLWVAGWYASYRTLASALGYSVLGYGGEVWDVYIPALVYLAQFGAFHAARFVSEVRRQSDARQALQAKQAGLERAAQDAQLAALRAQMDPHFLFNTLNSVAASVPPEQGATRDLVARLAGLVRYTLAAARRDRVLLGEEIDFVRDYLALEQERMGDRLTVEIDVDPGALDVSVPPMLVQPLVENAVRHGLAPTLAGGTVRVEARRVDGAVHVLVRDDGAGPGVPVAHLLGAAGGGRAPAASGGGPGNAAAGPSARGGAARAPRGAAVPTASGPATSPASAAATPAASGGEANGVGLANTDARLRALFGAGLVLDVPGSGDGQARGFEARFTVPATP